MAFLFQEFFSLKTLITLHANKYAPPIDTLNKLKFLYELIK